MRVYEYINSNNQYLTIVVGLYTNVNIIMCVHSLNKVQGVNIECCEQSPFVLEVWRVSVGCGTDAQ